MLDNGVFSTDSLETWEENILLDNIWNEITTIANTNICLVDLDEDDNLKSF